MAKFFRSDAERTLTLSIRLDGDNNVVGHILGSSFAHAAVNPALPHDLLQHLVQAYLATLAKAAQEASGERTGSAASSAKASRLTFRREGEP